MLTSVGRVNTCELSLSPQEAQLLKDAMVGRLAKLGEPLRAPPDAPDEIDLLTQLIAHISAGAPGQPVRMDLLAEEARLLTRSVEQPDHCRKRSPSYYSTCRALPTLRSKVHGLALTESGAKSWLRRVAEQALALYR